MNGKSVKCNVKRGNDTILFILLKVRVFLMSLYVTSHCTLKMFNADNTQLPLTISTPNFVSIKLNESKCDSTQPYKRNLIIRARC